MRAEATGCPEAAAAWVAMAAMVVSEVMMALAAGVTEAVILVEA